MIEMKPLYLQLSDQLIQAIQKIDGPQKFLSEREICQTYEVSRTTVRSALNRLENLGYISRQQGKGTFTSDAWQDRPKLSMGYSFTEQMQTLGKKPSSHLVSFGQILANKEVANALDIDYQTPVWYLNRIRLADEKAMMVELTYLPLDLFPKLSAREIEENSLYQLFENSYQQTILFADETFTASLLEKEQAKLLGVRTGDPCLSLTRKAYNHDRRIIEYTTSLARHDCFFYQVRHYNNR